MFIHIGDARIVFNRELIGIFTGDGGPIIFRITGDQSYLYLVLPIKKVN